MKKIILSLLCLAPLTACGVDTDMDIQTANQIARPAFMVERTIATDTFTLNAWERMHQRGQPATIYIEGDGAYIDAADGAINLSISPNPTPSNPVALHLASRDESENLGYLARPCQFMKMPENKGCNSEYWNEKKYTPVVLNAYETALNDLAARYDLTGFHLVGHGGGANIAAVLAATRDDIFSLRTVAGDVSPKFTNEYRNAMPLATNSVYATDLGTKLALIPQHHFIGAGDQQIPPGTYHSYRQTLGLSDCINYSVIQDATHTRGWVQIWPQLLQLEPKCAVIHSDLPPLPPAGDFPGNYNKGLGK